MVSQGRAVCGGAVPGAAEQGWVHGHTWATSKPLASKDSACSPLISIYLWGCHHRGLRIYGINLFLGGERREAINQYHTPVDLLVIGGGHGWDRGGGHGRVWRCWENTASRRRQRLSCHQTQDGLRGGRGLLWGPDAQLWVLVKLSLKS